MARCDLLTVFNIGYRQGCTENFMQIPETHCDVEFLWIAGRLPCFEPFRRKTQYCGDLRPTCQQGVEQEEGP